MRVEIETFVFFDLETTGLIKGNHLPKITEISLVASAKHCLLDSNGSLPRVMPRLTIPVDPVMLVPQIVTEITGLSNESLEHSRSFDDEVWQLLKSFVNILAPPVCFVAHCGISFDYPILWAELDSLGRTFSKNILAIDSLLAFQCHFESAATEKPANLKLFTVYKHLVGEPMKNAHSAENDCRALMECAIKIGRPFIEWAEHNARPLTLFRKEVQ